MDLQQIVSLYEIFSEVPVSLEDILDAAEEESPGRKCLIAFPF
ncbi:hypothetical protein [Sphingobacterium populi]|nr:hypothetical protein [Sphingobacterium sp. CFCC 11742]